MGELGPPMDGSEIGHHLQDLAVVDAGAVPLHAIRGLPDVASDHALGHAADELIPRGLAVATELYTRLGGIVEELIVLDPESDVPGFVVGPTVVGKCHGSFACELRLVYRVRVAPRGRWWTVPQASLCWAL